MPAVRDKCGCFPTGMHYPGIFHMLSPSTKGLVEGLSPEADWTTLPIAMIDVETTGTDPSNGRIVELGIVYWKDGQMITKSKLVNPGCRIPADSTAVHGITDDMVADAPTFRSISKSVAASLQGFIPGAYNASFDKSFLAAELSRAGQKLDTSIAWLDPLVWARHLQSGHKSRALSEVASRLGIESGKAHRAADDASTALQVLLKFSPDMPKEYGAMMREQRRLYLLQSDLVRFWKK